MFRKALTLLALGVFAGFIAAGTARAADTPPAKDAKAKETKAPKAATTAKTATKAAADEVAVMETSKGKIVVEFWEKDAPQTVANFKKLARQGFYDGTGFHRIIKGFMIQGGDPLSKNPNDPNLGTGNPGYTIPDEFNKHKHVPGVLSMAHSAAPNSGGSQFFIMDGVAPSLDGKYTAFGHVIQGMDVVRKIADTPCGPNPMMPGENSKPAEWTKIVSVKIEPRAVALGGGAAKAGTEKVEKTEKKAADAKESVKAAAPTGGGVDMKKAMES
jgi:peptidyl-prolyl cis-trans isomerase B (cyclophilin B)